MANKKRTTKAASTTTAAVTDKAAKFVELAQKRVTKAINAIRSVSKLSNRSNYVYTDAQVEKIADTLRQEVVDMFEHFSKTPSAAKEGFKL